MVQYQSFPGASGDSRTLDKLKALQMPSAAGARFLDVGCNEGFFCGFAHFQGAARSVGIDQSEAFIARARQRFPDCEFHAQDWTRLPEGEFDIILLASALHYADDQPALIERLVQALSPDGVLVLEIGIARSAEAVWRKVSRDADERLFPSMAMLREVLSGHAWKWMGPSIPQDGDPIPRHVVHVRRRRPVAYLLMEPPGLGKSSLAAHLFGATDVPVVSNDQVMSQLAAGKLQAPAELVAAAATDFSPFELDKAIARVFDAGLASELVALWCGQVDGGDFVMDGFIPDDQRWLVEQLLAERRYLPVRLSWDRVGAPPPPPAHLQEEADRFYLSLAQPADPAAPGSKAPAAVTGFVDDLVLQDGQLRIRGWAVAPDGGMPACLAVRVGGKLRVLTTFERQQRPDVQRHFTLRHDLLGFRLAVECRDVDDLQGIAVYGGADAETLAGPFPLAQGADARTGSR